MADQRFGSVLFLAGAQTDLHRMVAIILRRLFLQDGAGTQFNHGHANEIAVRVEQLGHAKFFAEKFHD